MNYIDHDLLQKIIPYAVWFWFIVGIIGIFGSLFGLKYNYNEGYIISLLISCWLTYNRGRFLWDRFKYYKLKSNVGNAGNVR